MTAEVVTFEEVLERAKKLPLPDQARLIAQLATTIKQELAAAQPATASQPRESLWGALAHLGPAPSAEDIDEMRREAWGNFPSEDI